MIKLEIGALVMLKSGSFAMTVWQIREELIDTVWMNGAIPIRDTFHFQEVVELDTKDVKFEDEVEGAVK